MIVLVDTSVFCNVIRLPGFCQNEEAILDEFRDYAEQGASFLLPLVVFYETGNFIGHLPDGAARRTLAERLRDVAIEALSGNAPWTPTPFPTHDQFMQLMNTFSDSATAGCGLADHTIIDESNRLRDAFPGRRIVIWTLDAALAAYSD